MGMGRKRSILKMKRKKGQVKKKIRELKKMNLAKK